MERPYQETAMHLADRWVVLMCELNRYRTGHHPDLLGIEAWTVLILSTLRQ